MGSIRDLPGRRTVPRTRTSPGPGSPPAPPTLARSGFSTAQPGGRWHTGGGSQRRAHHNSAAQQQSERHNSGAVPNRAVHRHRRIQAGTDDPGSYSTTHPCTWSKDRPLPILVCTLSAPGDYRCCLQRVISAHVFCRGIIYARYRPISLVVCCCCARPRLPIGCWGIARLSARSSSSPGYRCDRPVATAIRSGHRVAQGLPHDGHRLAYRRIPGGERGGDAAVAVQDGRVVA